MGVSELDAPKEMPQQMAVRVNKRSSRGKFGLGISPNIERAAVQREKKETPKPIPLSRSPKAQTVAPAMLGRTIGSYRTLIETCRARAEELELSRAEIDRIGGLPAGYSGKLLGKDGCGPRQRKVWPISLEALIGALGLRVVLIVDDAATARTLALRTPVDRANQRFGNVCRISAKLLPPPSQPVAPPVLTVVSAKRRGSKYG